MKKTRQIETLEDAVYDLIHNSDMPAKVQAEVMGVSYSRLINSCLSCAETAHHHTRWIIPQTQATRNFVLMDYLERMLGRVALPIPTTAVPEDPEAYRAGMLKIAKELGDLAGVCESGLSMDKYFDQQERAWIKKEAWDLIVQAVVFYRMVAE